jgi:hypothetical protein
VRQVQKRSGPRERPRRKPVSRSALPCLEARIALADHENFAATTHDLAVAMTGFGGLQRGQDFHTQLQPATGNRTILLMKHRADKHQSDFLVQAIAVADRAKAAKTG